MEARVAPAQSAVVRLNRYLPSHPWLGRSALFHPAHHRSCFTSRVGSALALLSFAVQRRPGIPGLSMGCPLAGEWFPWHFSRAARDPAALPAEFCPLSGNHLAVVVAASSADVFVRLHEIEQW